MHEVDRSKDWPAKRICRALTTVSAILLTAMGIPEAAAGGKTSHSVTLFLGDVGGVAGEKVQIPVTISSEGNRTAQVILFMEYDDTKLAFVDVIPSPNLPEGVGIEFALNPEFSQAEVGFDVFGLNQTTIPDGKLFDVELDVVAGQPGDQFTVLIVDTSAATASAEALTVTEIVENSAVNATAFVTLGCPVVTTPSMVVASDGSPDGVLVTWDPAPNATEYRVYRGATNNVNSAVPLSEWIADTRFLDLDTPPPETVFGCATEPEIRITMFYYWVKSRVLVGCESGFSAPDSGYRGDAAAAEAKVGDWAIVLVCLIVLAARGIRCSDAGDRRRNVFHTGRCS